MNKDAMFEKLDKSIASMREILEKNEGSTLQAIATGLKSVFDTVKTNVVQNEAAQNMVSGSRKYLVAFEKSLKSGDQKLSATLLDRAQKILDAYRTPKTAKDTEEVKAVETAKDA